MRSQRTHESAVSHVILMETMNTDQAVQVDGPSCRRRQEVHPDMLQCRCHVEVLSDAHGGIPVASSLTIKVHTEVDFAHDLASH